MNCFNSFFIFCSSSLVYFNKPRLLSMDSVGVVVVDGQLVHKNANGGWRELQASLFQQSKVIVDGQCQCFQSCCCQWTEFTKDANGGWVNNEPVAVACLKDMLLLMEEIGWGQIHIFTMLILCLKSENQKLTRMSRAVKYLYLFSCI